MKTEEDYIFYHHNNEYELNKTKKNFELTMMPSLLPIKEKENYNNITSYSKDKKFLFSNTLKTKSHSLNKKNRLPPLYIDNTKLSSFERRKKYKVDLTPKKNLKYYTKPKHDGLKLITLLLNKSLKNAKKKVKNDKKNKNRKNEMLYNYFLKKSEKRKIKINYILDEINKTEDRYNKENPLIDNKLKTNDRTIRDNMWKNSFYLDEYQNFFTRNLKGKISNINYRAMIKKFRDISLQCFSPGNSHIIPKKIDYIE